MSNPNTTRTTDSVRESIRTPIFDELAEHFRATPTIDELALHFRTIPVDIAPHHDTIDAEIIDVSDTSAPDTDTATDDPVVETKASKTEAALWTVALGATTGTIVWLHNLLNATAIA